MPVRVRLTEKLVRGAEPRGDDYQIFDEEVRGFALWSIHRAAAPSPCPTGSAGGSAAS